MLIFPHTGLSILSLTCGKHVVCRSTVFLTQLLRWSPLEKHTFYSWDLYIRLYRETLSSSFHSPLHSWCRFPVISDPWLTIWYDLHLPLTPGSLFQGNSPSDVRIINTCITTSSSFSQTPSIFFPFLYLARLFVCSSSIHHILFVPWIPCSRTLRFLFIFCFGAILKFTSYLLDKLILVHFFCPIRWGINLLPIIRKMLPNFGLKFLL